MEAKRERRGAPSLLQANSRLVTDAVIDQKVDTAVVILPYKIFTAAASGGAATSNIKPMATAIMPYSMAVAPDSSLRNFFIILNSPF